MKKCLFYAFLLGTTFSLRGQNLISNPSFETYTSPFCGIMQASDFDQTSVDWSVAGGTPDLYFVDGVISSTCYNYQPVNQYPGPIGIKGVELPRTGGVFAGFGVYTIQGLNQREYIQTALTSPMVVGKTYIVEFYISLADSVERYVNKIGAYLSTSSVMASGSNILNYSPQLVSSSPMSNYTGWTRIFDTITVTQPYSYITIGNFHDDNNTSTVLNPNASGGIGTYGSYYFIDDVRVEEVSNVLPISIIKDEEVLIYPNPVKETLTIELLKNNEIEGQILVHNINGQLVQSHNIVSNQMQLDWGELATGIYVVQIINRQQVLTKQVVKQ